MPPQVVTNIIESALLGLPNKKANGARLYRLLDEAKGSKVADGEDLTRLSKKRSHQKCRGRF